jgi:adenylate cyclase
MRVAARNPLFTLGLVLAAALVLDAARLHGFQTLENRFLDAFIRMQSVNRRPDPDIVIVDIDNASLTRMNTEVGSWPWPRAVHGELLAGIAAQNPQAIAFDILFSEPDRYRPESDAYFNEVLHGFERVYFPAVRLDASLDAQSLPFAGLADAFAAQATQNASREARVALLLPEAIERASWRLGLVNYLEDADGVGRRYTLFSVAQGWKIPSLPARVAKDLGFAIPNGQDIIPG